MALDPHIGTWTVASLVLIVPALVVGWFAVRSRVLAVAREREGFTGQFPWSPTGRRPATRMSDGAPPTAPKAFRKSERAIAIHMQDKHLRDFPVQRCCRPG